MVFNDAQNQAIRHVSGPAMIIAGPGSGKTTVITHRIKHLVQECQVNATNILVITFTKAAANEMQERYKKIASEMAQTATFGTFHAVFFRILKIAYGFTAANIIREEQRFVCVKEIVSKLDFDLEDESDLVMSILAEISLVKGEMINLEHYYSHSAPEEMFKKVYHQYEAYLRKINQIDFDDMLVLCHELLTQRADILLAWQKKYQYILIDEFQDINRVQYEIIQMLAKPHNHLFIVGDDDQSIYRFRGAKPEIMLGFERDYPAAKRIILSTNYRSTSTIVDSSNRLICHNQVRYDKLITSQAGVGKPLQTKVWNDAKEETLGIVKEVQDYLKMGFVRNDIAILYRTNQDARLLIEKLMEYNVPFVMQDTFPSIYDHWMVKNLIAYIKIAAGDHSRHLVLQIMNRPNRYLSRDSLEKQEILWEQVKSFYQDKEWMIERIEQLEYDLSMLSTMKPVAAVNYIRKGIGYDVYLKNYANERNIDGSELVSILDQIQESAAAFETADQWFTHMDEYGQQVKKQADSDRDAQDALSLMTMHRSKGLEFKIVYIIDANEGVTPHHKAVLDTDLEEERRMFYVAMTRAKERLHIYSVKERYGKKLEISRFVREYLQEG